MTQRFPEGASSLMPGFALGALVDPGLPNFGGTVGVHGYLYGISGFFKAGGGNQYSKGNYSGLTTKNYAALAFSFSAASSLDTSAATIYGKSTTVQPPSLGVKFIIRY